MIFFNVFYFHLLKRVQWDFKGLVIEGELRRTYEITQVGEFSLKVWGNKLNSGEQDS